MVANEEYPMLIRSLEGRPRRASIPVGAGALAIVLALGLGMMSSESYAYPRPGTIERLSVAAGGAEADQSSSTPTFSDDAGYVAFSSDASNLVADDTNGKSDVFVQDRVTKSIVRVSVTSQGAQATSGSGNPVISGDGRYVAFESGASDLVPEDTNGKIDVFLHDRDADDDGIFDEQAEAGAIETARVSVNGSGAEGAADSSLPTISDDGRFIAFQSDVVDLVPDDTNARTDIFVHDRDTQEIIRVSVPSNLPQSNGHSTEPDISDDGRYVAFTSVASNLVPGDTNSQADIFVHDRTLDSTVRVSVPTPPCGEANAPTTICTALTDNDSRFVAEDESNSRSSEPAISSTGRFVTFASFASNFAVEGNRSDSDIFVHDRDSDGNGVFDEVNKLRGIVTERVSVSSDGAESIGTTSSNDSVNPDISDDGRYIIFSSAAINLVPGDTNAKTDIFVHDRVARSTELVSAGSDGTAGDDISADPAISSDGRYVTFQSAASNLVRDDLIGKSDVFLRDRGEPLHIFDTLTGAATQSGVVVQGSMSFSGVVIKERPDSDPNAFAKRELGLDIVSSSVAYRREHEDLLFRIAMAFEPFDLFRNGGVVYGIRFEAGGILYEARASLRRAGTTAAANDVRPEPHVALYRCVPQCEEVTKLAGSIGTTDDEVLIRLPLMPEIAIREGATLSFVDAFASLGDTLVGGAPSHQFSPQDESSLGNVVIPEPRVELGIRSLAAPEADVLYEHIAQSLVESAFQATIPTVGLAAGEYRVSARACYGAAIVAACGEPATVDVAVQAPPSSSQSPTPTASATPSITPSATSSLSTSPTPTVTPSQSPTASVSQGAPSPMAAGLTVSKDKVRFGQKVLLNGHVERGTCQPEHVAVRIRRAGANEFKDFRTAPLSPDGTFLLALKPKHNAFYDAVVEAEGCDSATSTPVPIGVEAKVTAKTPKRCRDQAKISGAVKPNQRLTIVLLQRKIGKVWNDVSGDRLNRKSRYKVIAPSCKGTYQVVWRKQNELFETGAKRIRL